MAGLTGQWQEQLSEEFHKEYYQKLFLGRKLHKLYYFLLHLS